MNESQAIRAIELLSYLLAEQEGVEIDIKIEKKDDCSVAN